MSEKSVVRKTPSNRRIKRVVLSPFRERIEETPYWGPSLEQCLDWQADYPQFNEPDMFLSNRPQDPWAMRGWKPLGYRVTLDIRCGALPIYQRLSDNDKWRLWSSLAGIARNCHAAGVISHRGWFILLYEPSAEIAKGLCLPTAFVSGHDRLDPGLAASLNRIIPRAFSEDWK